MSKKMNDTEIKEVLRGLSKNIKVDDKVLLPDCKPSEFYDSTIDVEFKNVKLAKLIYFIADMI